MALPARKLEPNAQDEMSPAAGWLVPLALGTWGALVAGIIVGLGGFADPRPWQNGCVRLMTVGATLAALVWAVRTIHPQRGRGLKLAVVVSLIIHTLLAVLLSRQRLELRVADIAAIEESKPLMESGPVLSEDYPLSSADFIAREDDWHSPATRPQPPSGEAARRTTLPRHIEAATLPPNFAIDRASLGPRRFLKRGPPSLASLSLPPAASLAVGPIELPPVEAPQESTPAPTPVVKPTPRASAMARLEPSLPPAQIDLISEAKAGGALDIERLRSRRRVDAAPVFSFPAESERFATRSTAAPRVHSARQPSAAFERRLKSRIPPIGSSSAPDLVDGNLRNEAEAAIERGLEFLARVQLDDGRWEFEYVGPLSLVHSRSERVRVQADAAATGLALLALLGAGYDHFDGRYRHSIQHGLDFLCGVQAPSGELFPESGEAVGQVTRFYSHGMATLALCEAYGMTGDRRLKRPAQSAIDYLIATQHRQLGGWRYEAGSNADLSVTGWQLLALRSGELAGLEVPRETYERIRECLEQCRDEHGEGALFRYNPWASPTDPRTRHGRQPSTVMTSVGLLMQLQLDGERSSAQTLAAGDHLLANLPEHGESAQVAPTGTLGNPGRDTYYWYYATQAMFHLGGEYWQAWHTRLFPLLITSQSTSGPLAGSWDPRRPVPDKWAGYGGRLYVTAMNLLSFEVANRHLPLDDSRAPRVAEDQ